MEYNKEDNAWIIYTHELDIDMDIRVYDWGNANAWDNTVWRCEGGLWDEHTDQFVNRWEFKNQGHAAWFKISWPELVLDNVHD